MKNEGITLIALVITIVVLIILATVVVNLSLGDNGIFNRAREAKQQYQNAQTQEETEIAKVSNEINVESNREMITISREELNELIENKLIAMSSAKTTILYPNGTADNPGKISASNRIEINNPYPGHNVYARAEVFYNNKWGETGYIYSSGSSKGYGTKATQVRDGSSDKIVIQAGNGAAITVSIHAGNGFNLSSSAQDNLPFRVVVICLD